MFWNIAKNWNIENLQLKRFHGSILHNMKYEMKNKFLCVSFDQGHRSSRAWSMEHERRWLGGQYCAGARGLQPGSVATVSQHGGGGGGVTTALWCQWCHIFYDTANCVPEETWGNCWSMQSEGFKFIVIWRRGFDAWEQGQSIIWILQCMLHDI